MSLKKLLGLESFAIEDAEIIRRIQEASSKKQEVVEFISGKNKVRIKCTQIALEGVMRGYEDYYAK